MVLIVVINTHKRYSYYNLLILNKLYSISDISNEVLNSITEVLPIVFSRYQDLKSQSYVKEFVKVLMVSKPEACLINFTPILAEYVNTFPHLNIS